MEVNFVYLYKFSLISLEIFFTFKFLLILWGDFESNPSSCHWNLNSISAHDFVEMSLLEEYIHKFDIICLFETSLNSSLQSDDDNKSLGQSKR